MPFKITNHQGSSWENMSLQKWASLNSLKNTLSFATCLSNFVISSEVMMCQELDISLPSVHLTIMSVSMIWSNTGSLFSLYLVFFFLPFFDYVVQSTLKFANLLSKRERRDVCSGTWVFCNVYIDAVADMMNMTAWKSVL